GAGVLAAAVALAEADAYRPLTRAVAAALLLPAGAGLVAGVGYALSKQISGTLPVGSVFVVVALAVAAFGAAAGARAVVSADALGSAASVGIVVTAFAAAVFLPLAAAPVVGEFAETLYLPVLVPDPVPAAEFPGALLGGVARYLLDPTHEGPHLFSFGLVCYVAAFGLWSALRAFPVADLLSPDDPDSARRVVDPVRAFAGVCSRWGPAALFALAVLTLSPGGFEFVPSAVLRAVSDLASVSALRALLFVGGGVCLLLAAGSLTVRRLHAATARDAAETGAPFVTALAVVAAIFAFRGQLLSALVSTVADVLPGELAATFRTHTVAVVEFYGPEVVLLGVAVCLLLAASVAVVTVYVAVVAGAVTDRATGAAFAGGGVFVAAAVASTLGAGTALVLAGLVAGLVVRDAGAHGSTLGTEVGRTAPTRRSELVHLGASLSVGVVGAAAAVGLRGVVQSVPSVSTGVVPVALGAAFLGVVLFAAALR
ncbi:DUF7519 family protein, partial [Halopelagius longus]